jgi:hypothetical protein
MKIALLPTSTSQPAADISSCRWAHGASGPSSGACTRSSHDSDTVHNTHLPQQSLSAMEPCGGLSDTVARNVPPQLAGRGVHCNAPVAVHRAGCFASQMFWAALSVVDGTAQGLLDVIEKHFEAMKVPFSKVYSFASDGASVVSSEDHGVAGLLAKFVNAYVLSIHCIAHRQALVMKDAVRESTWAKWFDATLSQIINFFSHSVKREKELESFAIELEFKLLYTKILKLATTRWLSRGSCIRRVYDLFSALVRLRV